MDEHGRVMVWFPWDRAGKREDSTCWIRVSQGWAGASYGMLALPRIGHEVIVDFLEGDPDQPLVTGRSYHAANRPPYALPQHKTRSTWKSQTHKGEGSNEIRYEDEAGQEEIYVHAQRDQNNVVEHDETTRVGHDRTEDVGNDETIGIGNDRKENVGNDESITIGHDRQESVGNDETVTIGNHRNVTVGGAKIETVALAKAETIGLAKALTIGAAYQVSVGAAMNATIGLSKSEQVMLNKATKVGKKFNTVVGEEYVLQVGKATFVMKSDGTVIINGVKFEFGASGQVNIAGKNVDIN